MSAPLSRRDAAALLVLTLIWGVNWPIMKFGIGQLPPFMFRVVTIAGGMATLALIARGQGLSLRLPRGQWLETLRLSSTNTVGWFVLSIIGVAMLSSGRSAILAYTLPVWAALIGAVVYGERHGARLVLAVAAAMTGVGLLLAAEFGSLSGNPTGALVLLLAAALWALGTHQLRRRRSPAPIVVLTFWMTAAAFVPCLVLAIVFELRPLLAAGRPLPMPDGLGWLAITFNAVLAYGFAQLLWFRLASGLPPVVSALSVMLIPVVGVLSGQWLLGERASWTDYAALAAVIVAIAVTLLPVGPVRARR